MSKDAVLFFVPKGYVKDFTSLRKTLSFKAKEEQGKYKAGQVYDAALYNGQLIGVKVRVKSVTAYANVPEALDKEGISELTTQDRAHLNTIYHEPVDVVRFGVEG